MFQSLLKAVVGVVEMPVAVVNDVLTLGGALTDAPQPHIVEAWENIIKNIKDSTK